jgi:hypothetical protein
MILTLIAETMVAQIIGVNRRAGELVHEARELAVAHYNPNVVAGCDLFVSSWLLIAMQYDESARVARAALALAPDFGYRHVIESGPAWSLLVGVRIDEAAEVVAEFTPVPPGSQWAHSNTITTHVVMRHTNGPETAARSLSHAAREAILRRPKIASDSLVAFAYLAHLSGDLDRAQEITSNTFPFAAGSIRNFLVQTWAGAIQENAVDVVDAYSAVHPALKLFALETEHAPRLLAEELERWS